MLSHTTLIDKQPASYMPMDGGHSYVDEKPQPRCGCTSDDTMMQHSEHHTCHNHRFRRFFAPVMTACFLFVAAVLLISCFGENAWAGIASGLVPRATTDDNTFISHKIYIAVIIGGLIVVVILAIMLSAWCCKGSFQNPLCCPCYLCACCGGLACLECIGCGLCCEGLEEVV